MIRTFTRAVSPLLVLGLTGLWLLLNQTLAPGHVLLGLLLGTLLSWAGSALRPVHARVRRLDQVLVLLGVVFIDVLRSNVGVARVVLGLTGGRVVTSGFVDIPLDLRDPHGLAVLAMIITGTPGTVWVALSADGATLTIHVLDLHDSGYWVALVKGHYECRLMRIFE